MSNLNDLIHTNAVIAYKQGVERERERIIKLLEDEVRHDFPPIIEMSLDNLKALIKGEHK